MSNALTIDAGYTDGTIQSVLERYMNKKNNLPEWITTTEASEITGLKRDTIAEYCRRYEAGDDDRLVCQKRGRDWWVSSESALEFEADTKGRGRPRGKTN